MESPSAELSSPCESDVAQMHSCLDQILNQDRNSRVTPLQMRITLSDAYSCLSAAAVGSGMGIRRILSINGKEIGTNSDVDLANILNRQHNLDRGENHD